MSVDGLQQSLDALHSYCDIWNLTVNTSKTKIVIFSKGKLRNVPIFTFGQQNIEVQEDYVFLGTTFNYNGNFRKAKSKQITQAKRAIYSLIGKIRKLGLPIDITTHLFDTLITPILTYGSEVWGFSDIDEIEKVHIGFYKYLFHLNKSTPNCMIYGEFGLTPISKIIDCKMLNYWARLLLGKQSKFAYRLYCILKNKYDKDRYKSPWLSKIHSTLDNLGLSDIWISQTPMNIDWFKFTIKSKTSDVLIQEWNNSVDNAKGWCRFYKQFKVENKLEQYLTDLEPKYSIPLCKFRLSNHRLPVTTGRFNNIEYDQRLCKLCDRNVVGNETHYLYNCPFFKESRQKYIASKYLNNSQMIEIFKTEDSLEMKNLSIFTSIIMNQFKKD